MLRPSTDGDAHPRPNVDRADRSNTPSASAVAGARDQGWRSCEDRAYGNHRLLALWAASCAEHVLHLFESAKPDDRRPREAIEHARAWVRGEVSMMQAQAAGGHAMGAARDLRGAARHAAYAAGQAGAVAHVAARTRCGRLRDQGSTRPCRTRRVRPQGGLSADGSVTSSRRATGSGSVPELASAEPRPGNCSYSLPIWKARTRRLAGEERRAPLRAELGGATSICKISTATMVGCILATFPIVRRRDERAYGEYRARRLILQSYDAMVDVIACGTAYKTMPDSQLRSGRRNPERQRA
jgi:hypothetical protein